MTGKTAAAADGQQKRTMSAEPVSRPPHPVHQLTTSELTRYRRELEHAVKGISPEAPVQTELRRRLDVVLAEQDEREKIARG
jgi:hypothetical protein